MWDRIKDEEYEYTECGEPHTQGQDCAGGVDEGWREPQKVLKKGLACQLLGYKLFIILTSYAVVARNATAIVILLSFGNFYSVTLIK